MSLVGFFLFESNIPLVLLLASGYFFGVAFEMRKRIEWIFISNDFEEITKRQSDALEELFDLKKQNEATIEYLAGEIEKLEKEKNEIPFPKPTAPRN